MATQRETEIIDARHQLGDQRLLAFLRAYKASDILACKLINDELDAGKTLDEIFYTGDEFGYTLAVFQESESIFNISFGCLAGHFIVYHLRSLQKVPPWG